VKLANTNLNHFLVKGKQQIKIDCKFNNTQAAVKLEKAATNSLQTEQFVYNKCEHDGLYFVRAGIKAVG